MNTYIRTNEIKKGQRVKTSQLGVLVSGVMMDNLKGNTRLIKTHGSEVGLSLIHISEPPRPG